MPLVILQPCASTGALKHYKDTIEKTVKVSDIEDQISQQDIINLKEIYPSGNMRVWGVTPGDKLRNAKQWDLINTGDIALIAKQKFVFASAIITHKLQNRNLAKKLWGLMSDGQTWEYVYFLDELKSHKISYSEIASSINYKESRNIQRFQVLNEEKSDALMNAFDLESEVYFPSIETEEVYSEIQDQDSLDTTSKGTGRKEQRKLQEIHVKKKNPRLCSICGSEMPANLLVAAHIKKRSECSLDEKKDLNYIATAMCVLGCDSLFEKGYIGVKQGKVVAIKTPSTNGAQSHIDMLVGEECRGWNASNEKYYNWHFDKHSKQT